MIPVDVYQCRECKQRVEKPWPLSYLPVNEVLVHSPATVLEARLTAKPSTFPAVVLAVAHRCNDTFVGCASFVGTRLVTSLHELPIAERDKYKDVL